MSKEPVKQARSDTGQLFAQNIVAEAVTIFVALIFGVASSILIVRGLPNTPVYEFYIYILVFAWVSVLIPVGIMGIDVALMKHVPEVANRRPSTLYRLIGWSVIASLVVSLGIVVLVNFVLTWLPPDMIIPIDVVPFLQLALLTVPLTAVSTVLQGVFRGLLRMRYVTYAMALYHGLYFIALATFFVLGTMTLLGVILFNIVVSVVTIIFEVVVLFVLLRKQHGNLTVGPSSSTRRPFLSTASQALMLALLGAVFLNIPLLIANMFRTSNVILAGLGLAMSVAVYMQRGQAAPFRVLIPQTSGDVVQEGWSSIRGYMDRAWKLGLLFSAFIAVVVVFYATPVLVVFFAVEGLVAAPFLMLMAGSFLIYPLAALMMDTLIGVGSIRAVLATYAAWTGSIILLLWFLSPVVHEIVAALIWVAGIPFLLIFLWLFQRRTGIQVTSRFIPRTVGVLAVVALLFFTVLVSGWFILTLWNLLGLLAWGFQVVLILTLVPLSIFFLWSLNKTGVLEPVDVTALLRMSEVLHPLSKPVSWLIERMD
jgi:O-antigen/teichoic acid export membrane protein